jgi:hypothetical protein
MFPDPTSFQPHTQSHCFPWPVLFGQDQRDKDGTPGWIWNMENELLLVECFFSLKSRLMAIGPCIPLLCVVPAWYSR